MKWYWYLLPVLIILLIIAVIQYNNASEGFQTISNVEYKFKEVFLVAPTAANEKGNPIPIYSVPNVGQYTNQGYTWEEAKQICVGYGGDLATAEEVKKAYDNSGNWCPSGWTLNSTTTAYYLPSITYPCQLTRTTIPTTVPSISAPIGSNNKRRAFAICNAPKPPDSTRSIIPFNSSRYSMISSDLLSRIMLGTGGDVFPISFTSSQAYYAIDNVPLNSDNSFSFGAARQWLVQNYRTVDSMILAATGETDDPTRWATLDDAVKESCDQVQIKDNRISEMIKTLQQHFRDISGSVIAVMKSKAENASIQGMLLEVCSNTTPADSPACAKLATLDFDLFYTSPTHNTLADLESLNSQLYVRREEVCAILNNIRFVKSSLGCSYSPLVAECSEGCSTKPGVYDCSNSTIFDINGVGGLKYALEQISPLFDKPAYNDILKSVLQQLSYVVETPSLAKFDMSYDNMRLITTAINDIRGMIQYNYRT